jgi:hypothetical protein
MGVEALCVIHIDGTIFERPMSIHFPKKCFEGRLAMDVLRESGEAFSVRSEPRLQEERHAGCTFMNQAAPPLIEHVGHQSRILRQKVATLFRGLRPEKVALRAACSDLLRCPGGYRYAANACRTN